MRYQFLLREYLCGEVSEYVRIFSVNKCNIILLITMRLYNVAPTTAKIFQSTQLPKSSPYFTSLT